MILIRIKRTYWVTMLGAFFKIPLGFGSDAERGGWVGLSSSRDMMNVVDVQSW